MQIFFPLVSSLAEPDFIMSEENFRDLLYENESKNITFTNFRKK